MANETNRTKRSPNTELYDERHRLTPTTSVWAAVPLPVLRLLQHEDVDRAIRVLFYLIEHSWATMIPPTRYRGDGQDRYDWRPSTFAVKEPQKPGRTARSPFWSLEYIRSKDISDDLGLDEGNVSKELKWLGDRGAIRTDAKGRPIFPIQVLDVPSGLARKKLSDSTTSDFQHPYFQQLLDYRLRIEAAYEEAKREALAPVDEAYRPAFEIVNTQEKELRKAAKKAKRQGVELDQVVKVDNLEQLKLIVPTETPAISGDSSPETTSPEVVKVDNSKPLSPIRRVVKVDNFSGRIKREVETKILDNNNSSPRPRKTSPSDGVVVVVLQEINEQYGSTTEPAVRKLVDRCRKEHPGCTAEDITRAMRSIAKGFTKSTANPVGVLLTQTPIHKSLKATPPKPKPATTETGPACAVCRDTGLMNFEGDWQTAADVAAAIHRGAQPCTCESGNIARQLAEIPA